MFRPTLCLCLLSFVCVANSEFTIPLDLLKEHARSGMEWEDFIEHIMYSLNLPGAEPPEIEEPEPGQPPEPTIRPEFLNPNSTLMQIIKNGSLGVPMGILAEIENLPPLPTTELPVSTTTNATESFENVTTVLPLSDLFANVSGDFATNETTGNVSAGSTQPESSGNVAIVISNQPIVPPAPRRNFGIITNSNHGTLTLHSPGFSGSRINSLQVKENNLAQKSKNSSLGKQTTNVGSLSQVNPLSKPVVADKVLPPNVPKKINVGTISQVGATQQKPVLPDPSKPSKSGSLSSVGVIQEPINFNKSPKAVNIGTLSLLSPVQQVNQAINSGRAVVIGSLTQVSPIQNQQNVQNAPTSTNIDTLPQVSPVQEPIKANVGTLSKVSPGQKNIEIGNSPTATDIGTVSLVSPAQKTIKNVNPSASTDIGTLSQVSSAQKTVKAANPPNATDIGTLSQVSPAQKTVKAANPPAATDIGSLSQVSPAQKTIKAANPPAATDIGTLSPVSSAQVTTKAENPPKVTNVGTLSQLSSAQKPKPAQTSQGSNVTNQAKVGGIGQLTKVSSVKNVPKATDRQKTSDIGSLTQVSQIQENLVATNATKAADVGVLTEVSPILKPQTAQNPPQAVDVSAPLKGNNSPNAVNIGTLSQIGGSQTSLGNVKINSNAASEPLNVGSVSLVKGFSQSTQQGRPPSQKTATANIGKLNAIVPAVNNNGIVTKPPTLVSLMRNGVMTQPGRNENAIQINPSVDRTVVQRTLPKPITRSRVSEPSQKITFNARLSGPGLPLNPNTQTGNAQIAISLGGNPSTNSPVVEPTFIGRLLSSLTPKVTLPEVSTSKSVLESTTAMPSAKSTGSLAVSTSSGTTVSSVTQTILSNANTSSAALASDTSTSVSFSTSSGPANGRPTVGQQVSTTQQNAGPRRISPAVDVLDSPTTSAAVNSVPAIPLAGSGAALKQSQASVDLNSKQAEKDIFRSSGSRQMKWNVFLTSLLLTFGLFLLG